MVSVDTRWAVDDVEAYVFGAETTAWHPKLFDSHMLHVLHNFHNTSCFGE